MYGNKKESGSFFKRSRRHSLSLRMFFYSGTYTNWPSPFGVTGKTSQPCVHPQEQALAPLPLRKTGGSGGPIKPHDVQFEELGPV